MSNSIENIATVVVTPAQAKAIRKLALRSTSKSAQELANDLFAQVVRGRYKAISQLAMKDAGERWDNAASFLGKDKMPQTREEFCKSANEEHKLILSEL